MFNIVRNPSVDYEKVPEDLSGLLIQLLNYGHPRISHHSGGWHCNVEMNTNTTGADFKISSDFDIPTPYQAAKQCHERIINTLKNLTK